MHLRIPRAVFQDHDVFARPEFRAFKSTRRLSDPVTRSVISDTQSNHATTGRRSPGVCVDFPITNIEAFTDPTDASYPKFTGFTEEEFAKLGAISSDVFYELHKAQVVVDTFAPMAQPRHHRRELVKWRMQTGPIIRRQWKQREKGVVLTMKSGRRGAQRQLKAMRWRLRIQNQIHKGGKRYANKIGHRRMWLMKTSYPKVTTYTMAGMRSWKKDILMFSRRT
ncbi:hypothetical protein BC829DRAFT_398620 [Chytridium lagenaria]|nr:hypothetical protein BC829DRAFT_398620 [Chytridium lagenaria]